jgi:hypothetical protein
MQKKQRSMRIQIRNLSNPTKTRSQFEYNEEFEMLCTKMVTKYLLVVRLIHVEGVAQVIGHVAFLGPRRIVDLDKSIKDYGTVPYFL